MSGFTLVKPLKPLSFISMKMAARDRILWNSSPSKMSRSGMSCRAEAITGVVNKPAQLAALRLMLVVGSSPVREALSIQVCIAALSASSAGTRVLPLAPSFCLAK